MKKPLLALLLLPTLVGAAWAQPGPATAEKRELIYCADLMTHEERNAYRARMQATRSFEEKEKIRAAHREEMQARAASQGRAGECQPQGRGPGRGPGQGPGAGQGFGPGQGQGGGRR